MVTIHIDGAARGNPGPAGYGVHAIDADGETLASAYGYIGEQTNNFAEYIALLAALELAHRKTWKRIRIRSDSQLMVRQLNGEYKVKNPVLSTFYRRAQILRSRFEKVTIEHVKREQNKAADRLANTAVDKMESHPKWLNPVKVKRK